MIFSTKIACCEGLGDMLAEDLRMMTDMLSQKGTFQRID